MKTKLITTIMAMLFLASMVMFTTTSVKASPYTALDYDTAIVKVANWILRHQAVDGAFDAECSWSDCSYGTGYTDVYDYNVLGRIGNTLLDAYDLTGDTYYLEGDATYPVGAKKTADLLMLLHWADPLPPGCHWWTSAVKGRWRSDDYLFMLRYAAISGDASYSTKAYAEWVSFKTECDNFRGCSAPIDPDEWINNMLTIYGYDESCCMYEVAPYIYAAYVLGDTTWADEVAVACTTAGDSPDLVEMLDGETWDPGLAGALLFALQKLDPSAYAADIAVLTDWLKATQNPDGSWSDAGGYTYQDTAWAIKGLAAVEEWEAAIDGADYLVSTQTTDSGIHKIGGYWYFSLYGYMVWVDAEDAQGLAQLSFNPIFRLEDLKTEINALTSGDLKPPVADRKVALIDKINEVIAKIVAGDYMGAIMKLEKDIKPKLDGVSKQTWAMYPLEDLLEKIDAVVGILKGLL